MKKFIVAALLLMGITFLRSNVFAENEDGTSGHKDVKERKLKMENRTVPFSKRPTSPSQISTPEIDEDQVKEAKAIADEIKALEDELKALKDELALTPAQNPIANEIEDRINEIKAQLEALKAKR